VRSKTIATVPPPYASLRIFDRTVRRPVRFPACRPGSSYLTTNILRSFHDQLKCGLPSARVLVLTMRAPWSQRRRSATFLCRSPPGGGWNATHLLYRPHGVNYRSTHVHGTQTSRNVLQCGPQQYCPWRSDSRAIRFRHRLHARSALDYTARDSKFDALTSYSQLKQ
jgi:hypothetical protein